MADQEIASDIFGWKGPATKRCKRCGTVQAAVLFGKDTRKLDGRGIYCNACIAAYKRARYARSPKMRAACQEGARFFRYRLSKAAFQAMWDAQNGKCAICQDQLNGGRQTAVDHCHATGRIRELLCTLCNTALGRARDNPQLLRAMAAYLERHQAQETG